MKQIVINAITHWKTTSTGLLMIIGGITAIVHDSANLAAGATAILGGIGLILAPDAKAE